MRFVRNVAAALVFGLCALPAMSAGLVIPAAGRVDMVHDFKRDRVYITEGGSLLRYDRASASFLPPIALGGSLKGADISLDGDRLAVADATVSGTDLVVHVIDLESLAVTQFRAPLAFYESGTWSVAYGADGSLLASSRFNGSGWVPLRKFDAAGNPTVIWNSVRQDTMLTSSGDRTRAGFAESNSSDGPWGRYDFTTGILEELTGYTRGTSWFNFEIGSNRNGTQFAVPTYGGTFFYNDALVKIATVGTYAGPQPIGVAYHPVENRVYFPWATTNLVKVYDTTTFTEVGSVATTQSFSTTGNRAYVSGRTKLSADGSLLMVTVGSGVELLQLYAPLAASTVTATTEVDTAATFALGGSIGNNGALAWSIDAAPASGTVTLSGRNATYVPNAGFAGTDQFTYVVRYGEAEVSATATVTVVAPPPPNNPPQANDQSVAVNEDAPAAFTLSASDPEGQPLVYTLVSQPLHGTLSGTAPNLVYTPNANYNGSDAFAFRASDGVHDSNVATVSITVAPVNDAPVALDAAASVQEDGSVAIVLQASDIDGDALQYAVASGPQHGTLSGTAPNLVYTPAPDFSGTDSFTFRASDGASQSNLATVTIQVAAVNDAPVARPDFATAPQRTTIMIAVLANDSDADGDSLTIVSVGQPARGTVSIVGNMLQFNAPPQKATYQFPYTITDGRGTFSTATVSVTVVN